MLENLKIKIHRFRVGREAPKFVNPYAKPNTERPLIATTISPYATDYGTKKNKSFSELISGIFKKGEPEDPLTQMRREKGLWVPAIEDRDLVEEEPLPAEPTLFSFMREIIEDDAIFVASKLPHIKPREKRGMSSEEIARACARLQW
jgi:hypothetical protein